MRIVAQNIRDMRVSVGNAIVRDAGKPIKRTPVVACAGIMAAVIVIGVLFI